MNTGKSLRARVVLVWALAGSLAVVGGWQVSDAASSYADKSPAVTASPLGARILPPQGGRLSGAARLTLRLPININTATARDLEALPRIGPVLAQRLVDYRTRHGAFASPADVMAVRGIGPVTLDRMLEAGITTDRDDVDAADTGYESRASAQQTSTQTDVLKTGSVSRFSGLQRTKGGT